MMLVLLQVFILFISASLSSAQVGPPVRPPQSGPPVKPPVKLNPSNLKKWLDDPNNMKILWGLAKQSLLVLPPPKNLDELEYFLTTINQVVSQKLALIKNLAAGDHPEVSKKLEALGPNPHPGRVQHSDQSGALPLVESFIMLLSHEIPPEGLFLAFRCFFMA